MFTALGPHGWLYWFISASQRCRFRIGGILLFAFAPLGPRDRYSDQVSHFLFPSVRHVASDLSDGNVLPPPHPAYPLGTPILKRPLTLPPIYRTAIFFHP
jgi:hypothetical protein